MEFSEMNQGAVKFIGVIAAMRLNWDQLDDPAKREVFMFVSEHLVESIKAIEQAHKEINTGVMR